VLNEGRVAFDGSSAQLQAAGGGGSIGDTAMERGLSAVLLGEPGRQTGDLFVEWIAQRGWRLTRHAEKVETRQQPIRLFELHLWT